MGKKQKTYLYVITGIGHNSENGPKLRPNVINYLNQNRIKFDFKFYNFKIFSTQLFCFSLDIKNLMQAS